MSAGVVHRREIDGLRTLAVIPVVLFHAGFGLFSGGYVGVDVFFVISGYLITTIILREKQAGNFTIVGFYERRARRILPALLFVLAVCAVCAWQWMLPTQMQSFSEGLAAVSMFASNILFWRTSGYFDTASEENPLLHTWSLGIEEQYYVLFPLLVLLLWRFGRRRMFWFMVLVAVISLAYCEWGWRARPSSAFYLLPMRAWELMIGGLLAFAGFEDPLHGRISTRTADVLAGIGVFMILGAIFFFDRHTPFPSVYALLPTVGTALVLAFAHPGGWTARVLSWRVMVGIGLISYSLYLWHQPVLAFARIHAFDPLSPLQYAALCVLALVLAIISYFLVEKPFRNRARVSRNQIFALAIVGSGFFIVMGVAGYLNGGFPNRLSMEQRALAESVTYSPKREACHTGGDHYLHPRDACVYLSGPTTWAVFGNSYGVELAYALAEGLKTRNESVLHLSFSDCPPELVPEAGRVNCYRWTEEALQRVLADPGIKNVLLSYSQGSYQEEGTRESHWHSFRGIVARLQSAQKRVYVLFPVPQPDRDITKYVRHGRVDGPTRARFEERNRFVLQHLNALPWGVNLIKVQPAEVLCDLEQCYTVIDNTAMYFDSHHISVDGARRVLARTLREAR